MIPTKNAQDLKIVAKNITLDQIREDKIVEVFIDRDQKLFETLVQFLRNEREHYPEFDSVKEEIMFAQELQYWKIPNPNFAEKKLISSLPEPLVMLLAGEPTDIKPEPLM